MAQALRQVFSSSGLPAALNGLDRVVLSMLAVINGVLVHPLLTRSTATAVSPLPVIAVFYGVVSVHFQIPLYLYFSAGLTLTSILWMAPAVSSRATRISLVGALGLASIAVIFHAGQPTSRSIHAVLRGDRYPAAKASGLPHCSLNIDAEEAVTYRKLVDMITAHAKAGESIFAVPSNAELYFSPSGAIPSVSTTRPSVCAPTPISSRCGRSFASGPRASSRSIRGTNTTPRAPVRSWTRCARVTCSWAASIRSRSTCCHDRQPRIDRDAGAQRRGHAAAGRSGGHACCYRLRRRSADR